MFDLIETIKKKTGLDDLFGDGMSVPKSVQDVIKIDAVYSDGIFLTGKDRYSKTFKFTDINYAVSSKEDKEENFLRYSEILNSLENGISSQITIINRKLKKAELKEIALLEIANDDKDKYRKEINDMLTMLANGANAIVQDKYVTLSIQKKTIEEARNHFNRVGADLKAHFSRLGSKCTELDLTERLRVIHDFCRPKEAADYHFDLRDTMQKGQSFKDYISPDGFEFKSDYFKMGDRFGRVLFIRDYPSYIKDSVVWELTDANRNMIFNFDIIPVSTEEAQKFGEKQALGIETNIANYQRKQNANNNYTSVIPYDLEQQRKEIREFLDDLTTRDQKMFKVVITVMHTAETFEELNNDTEAIQATGRKHMCQLGVLKYQQLDGFNATLPIGINKIEARRTLTTESLAVFMPFKVQEIQHDGGVFQGVNVISKNMIIVNRKFLLNGNCFILGVSGSGKSFTAKEEMVNLLLSTNADVMIIDPEREYSALVEAMGGQVIELSAKSKNHINCLDINKEYADGASPIAFKAEFVLSLFEQVMGKDGIDAIQKSIVDRCLTNVYKNYIKRGYTGKVPTLVDLCNDLRKQTEHEATELATAMELFASGSHSTFAQKTNVNIENRLICYDILELGSQLMPIGMLVVLDSILNRITKNRAEGRETYIFIDEIYLLFQHEYSANFLFTLWKRVRKYGAYCTGITQNVDDLLQSHTARTMLANSEFIIMLNQGSTDREELANLLQISETQMTHITNVEVGHGLVKVQKVDLVNLYKDRYGYAIPPAILNEILLSLYSCNKIDFLKNDYIDIKKSAIEECSFLYKATLNRFKSSFSTFAKENDVTVNPKDTVQVFLDFMLKNAVDLNSFFNCLHEDSEINNEQEDDYSKIIIKYLMKIRLENTEIFELLNDIYYGIALSSVMKLDKAEISDLEHNNNITELIVDSNYVFRLLDLQTKYEHQTTIHTHKLAQDAGVEFYILPDTLEQIATTLTRFLDSINPNTISALSPYGDELFSGIHSAYIRNNFSKTELYELITNLQERLECEYSIKSWTKQIADVTESDYEIIESMQKFKPTTDDAGLIHDLKLVKTIDLIRPAYVADMSKAKCWVLTDDNKLMKWSASKYNKKRIPQCLTEAQLSTILWLRSPKEFNGQAFENVVFALLNQSLINKEQYRRISESIEKQKERFSGNPKKLDVMSLLFSTKCLSLNEIDSAADSDEELNRLFDEKMEQSQQYVESVNQVNENYRSENEHIKYMLTKSQNDVEISQRIISEQEKEIITSLQNSIATMELFLSDK